MLVRCIIFSLEVISKDNKENGMQHKEIISNNTQRVRISTKEIKAREVQYIDTKLKHIDCYTEKVLYSAPDSPLYRIHCVCVIIDKTVLHYTQFEHRTISMILQRSMAKAYLSLY